jgi:hypothetical protein
VTPVHSANGFSPYKSLIYKGFLLSGFWVSPPTFTPSKEIPDQCLHPLSWDGCIHLVQR